MRLFLSSAAQSQISLTVAQAIANPDRAVEILQQCPDAALPSALAIGGDVAIQIAARFPQITMALAEQRAFMCKDLVVNVSSMRVKLCQKYHKLIEHCLEQIPESRETLRKGLCGYAIRSLRYNECWCHDWNYTIIRGFAKLFPERTVEFCLKMRRQPEVVLAVNPEYAHEVVAKMTDTRLIGKIVGVVPERFQRQAQEG